ncbi:MAG TPA: CcdB family protein [Luteimonas sp.]|nr:CcdB family protein [Luteimonas sp.]
MAQFDVHRNPGRSRAAIPFVLVVQTAAFDEFSRRVVVPLVRKSHVQSIHHGRFNPTFVIENIPVVLHPLEIVSVPLGGGWASRSLRWPTRAAGSSTPSANCSPAPSADSLRADVPGLCSRRGLRWCLERKARSPATESAPRSGNLRGTLRTGNRPSPHLTSPRGPQ